MRTTHSMQKKVCQAEYSFHNYEPLKTILSKMQRMDTESKPTV